MRGMFEEDLQRSISRGRGSTTDMFFRDVRRSGGADFLRVFAFWSIRVFRFPKVILRHTRSTSYDLASLFRGRRSTLERWD